LTHLRQQYQNGGEPSAGELEFIGNNCARPPKAHEFEREIIRKRVKAGLAQALAEGKTLGRPPSVTKKEEEVKRLFAKGLSKSEIARRLEIGRTSVRRLLEVS
jgi:DNA-binding NarL/FixJ family response regulator